MKNYSAELLLEVIMSEFKLAHKIIKRVYSKLKSGAINLHIENGRINITDRNNQILLSLPLNTIQKLLE